MKKLRKSFYLGCTSPGDDFDVDAVNLVVHDGPAKDGALYEFTIALVQFRDGRYAIESRVFSDAWRAYRDCPEVFEILAVLHGCFQEDSSSPEPFDTLVDALRNHVWKDMGRRQSRYYRICRACGQEVKMTPPAGRGAAPIKQSVLAKHLHPDA